MKFNLENKEEIKLAKEYLLKLEDKKAIVEILQKHKKRTLSQNNYLHLLLSYSALHYGETMSYFKEYIWKRHINKDIFLTEYVNPKNGNTREDWKSSADISTKEMTIAVDRLILFASKEMGLELPDPHDLQMIRHIENHIERNTRYL